MKKENFNTLFLLASFLFICSSLLSQAVHKIKSNLDEVLGSYQINEGDSFFTPMVKGQLAYRLESASLKMRVLDPKPSSFRHYPESQLILWTPGDRKSETIDVEIYLTATDGSDSMAKTASILLPLRRNRKPSKVEGLELIGYKQHGKPFETNLSSYFSDPENDPLRFKLHPDNPCIATIEGSILKIGASESFVNDCVVRFMLRDDESNDQVFSFRVLRQDPQPTKPVIGEFPKYTYVEGSTLDIAIPIVNAYNPPVLSVLFQSKDVLGIRGTPPHIYGEIGFDVADEDNEKRDCALATEKQITITVTNMLGSTNETLVLMVKPAASPSQTAKYEFNQNRFKELKERAHFAMNTALKTIHTDLAKSAKQQDVKNLISGLLRIAGEVYIVTNPAAGAFIAPALKGVDTLQINKERKGILKENLKLLNSAHSSVQPVIAAFRGEYPTFMESQSGKPCLFTMFSKMDSKLNELEDAVLVLEGANSRIIPLFNRREPR